MVNKQKKGGIGATDPLKTIQNKWPNDWKVWKCEGAIITSKGMHSNSRRMQLVHIPDIDDGTVFHIVVCKAVHAIIQPNIPMGC